MNTTTTKGAPAVPLGTLDAYAARVLAGTGLTVDDVTGEDTVDEASAAYALRHGWDMARRADQVDRSGTAA